MAPSRRSSCSAGNQTSTLCALPSEMLRKIMYYAVMLQDETMTEVHCDVPEEGGEPDCTKRVSRLLRVSKAITPIAYDLLYRYVHLGSQRQLDAYERKIQRSVREDPDQHLGLACRRLDLSALGECKLADGGRESPVDGSVVLLDFRPSLARFVSSLQWFRIAVPLWTVIPDSVLVAIDMLPVLRTFSCCSAFYDPSTTIFRHNTSLTHLRLGLTALGGILPTLPESLVHLSLHMSSEVAEFIRGWPSHPLPNLRQLILACDLAKDVYPDLVDALKPLMPQLSVFNFRSGLPIPDGMAKLLPLMRNIRVLSVEDLIVDDLALLPAADQLRAFHYEQHFMGPPFGTTAVLDTKRFPRLAAFGYNVISEYPAGHPRANTAHLMWSDDVESHSIVDSRGMEWLERSHWTDEQLARWLAN